MNNLRILIARLGWPATSARWWTIQELAARLGEPETKAETESSLLQLLRSRKLEAEVVEVLCIFWMAIKEYNYSPTTFLAENILLPSPLSTLLMKAFGLSIQLVNTNLELVPENFIIPDDFDSVQGIDLSRIFHTTISRLETFTRRPFVEQMDKEPEDISRRTIPGGCRIFHSAPGRWLCPSFFHSNRSSRNFCLSSHASCGQTHLEDTSGVD